MVFIIINLFINQAYIKSPNCCVEFWEAVQTPKRLIICVLEPLPVDIENYIHQLEKEGTKVVNGILEYNYSIFSIQFIAWYLFYMLKLLTLKTKSRTIGGNRKISLGVVYQRVFALMKSGL